MNRHSIPRIRSALAASRARVVYDERLVVPLEPHRHHPGVAADDGDPVVDVGGLEVPRRLDEVVVRAADVAQQLGQLGGALVRGAEGPTVGRRSTTGPGELEVVPSLPAGRRASC